MVAHRGDPVAQPENTLGAFSAAARAGADLVETDVRLTSDGVAVLIHDAGLSRTTDRSGLVHEATIADVKRADASGGRGPRQEVPTLAEALDLLGSLGLGVNLEIKNAAGDGYDPDDRALLEALRLVAGFPGPVLVSSFNPGTIARSRAEAPEVATAVLTPVPVPAGRAIDHAREAGHAVALPAAAPILEAGRGAVEEAHAAGLAIGAWTVDGEADIATLLGWRVDLIITNHPARAVAVRAAASSGEEAEGAGS